MPNQFWVPNFCELDSGTCTAIVDTKYGRILGRSNAQLGGYFMSIYALLLLGIPFQLVPPMIPFIIGILTILLGIYLIFGLIQLKMPCPICITIHGLNIIIFILQWI